MKRNKQKEATPYKLFKMHKTSALIGIQGQCKALRLEMDKTGRAYPYMAQMAALHAQAKQIAAMGAKEFYELINKKGDVQNG